MNRPIQDYSHVKSVCQSSDVWTQLKLEAAVGSGMYLASLANQRVFITAKPPCHSKSLDRTSKKLENLALTTSESTKRRSFHQTSSCSTAQWTTERDTKFDFETINFYDADEESESDEFSFGYIFIHHHDDDGDDDASTLSDTAESETDSDYSCWE
mgnify:CR=1 FL=1